MARQIDFDKPLSAADREWLLSRNQHDIVARMDREHGTTDQGGDENDSYRNEVQRLTVFLEDDLGHERQEGESSVDMAIRLLQAAYGDAEEPEGDAGAPEDVGTTEETADGSDEDADEDDAEALDYEDWTNQDLKDELARRELSRSGNKEEMIARLREHDELGD